MNEATPCPTCGYQIDRVQRLNTENARLRAAADNFLHEQTEENANKLAAVLGGFPVRGYEQQETEN